MTKLRHYDDLGTARFVTFSCYYRQPYLNRPGAKESVMDALNKTRARHGFRILGYVLMPEHVHLVLFRLEGMKLGLVIREIKSLSARQYFRQHPIGPLGARRVPWQNRCYDHNCRSPQAVWEKVRYCHYNPVKRGLVSDPALWEWSSYNWYQGRRDVPLVINCASGCTDASGEQESRLTKAIAFASIPDAGS